MSTNSQDGSQKKQILFVHGFNSTKEDYEGLLAFLKTMPDVSDYECFEYGRVPKCIVVIHWICSRLAECVNLALSLVNIVLRPANAVLRLLKVGLPLRVPTQIGVIPQAALTTDTPRFVTLMLKKHIRKMVADRPDKELVLVGHSMGAVFLRAAYLDLHPRTRERIDRVILLAATNRGYQPHRLFGHRVPLFLAERWPWVLLSIPATLWVLLSLFTLLLSLIFNVPAIRLPAIGLEAFLLALLLLFVGPRCDGFFLVSHLIAGAKWITKLRLQWINQINEASENSNFKWPLTIFIRGKEDPLVHDEDCFEFRYFKNVCEPVPLGGVGHHEFKMTPRSNADKNDTSGDEERIKAAREEFGLDAEIKKAFEQTEFLEPKSLPPQRRIVFLIHGIRDFAQWYLPLADRIEAECEVHGTGGDENEVKTVPITYGYFSAFQFLLPAERQRCSQVFRDRYVWERSLAPNAKCFVVAHSNGTFVFGNVVQGAEPFEFERAYLAGCVLHRNFPWPDTGVKTIFNQRAKRDFPVGVLCRSLSVIYPDLGSAGVDGFEQKPKANQDGSETLEQPPELEGGHGAALERWNLPTIARFLIDGSVLSPTPPREVLNQKHSNLLLKLCSRHLEGATAWTRIAIVVGLVIILGCVLTITATETVSAVILGSLATFLVVRLLHNA